MILTNSNYSLEQLKKIGVTKPIEVSYLGIDLELFQPISSERKELIPTLISVARLGHSKNHEYLFRVFLLVAREEPNTVLWLVGDGPKRHQLSKLAEEMGLSQGIKFLGAVSQEEIAIMYRKSWISLLFSEKEGLGLKGNNL